MNVVTSLLEQFRRMGLEGHGALRPSTPKVAVEVNPREVVLVRVKRRRGRDRLEAIQVRPVLEPAIGPSLVRPGVGSSEEVSARIREAFEASGTRPGKVSLILPDSVAKVTLLALPERPSSRKQLAEMVRFKLRKSVPFRLEEASLSYQLLPGGENEATVLVAIMLRSIVEPYERILEGIGARPGVVGLCTPNLFNLCRHQLGREAAEGGDVALLNCAQAYFSLLIMRGEKLIFYRCKSYAAGEEAAGGANGAMNRELATSFSYYQEKLQGRSVGTAYVRTVGKPFHEVAAILEPLGVERVEILDPATFVTVPKNLGLDPTVAQKIAPAVGAASGGKRS